MKDRQAEDRLGKVLLDPPGSVVAGHFGTWTIVLTVGSFGIDEGGTIKLAQRYASDWQEPQFDRPTESGYTTITTTGQAKLAPRFEKKGHIRPWMKCLILDVYDGTLAPGDLVTLVLGDRSHGSPGIRAQTFIESGHEFRILVDPTNACVVERLPSSPVFPVVAGEAVELVAIVPTQAKVGEPVEVFVKGQDRWGNPAPWTNDIRLAWEGEGTATIDGQRLTFTAPGTGSVLASSGGVTGRSNPVTGRASPPLLRRYWGDLHAQTETTLGTGSDEEYFAFGRDVARLDFMSHQGNDFQVTDESWRNLQQTVRRFHEDGRFVVFPGYEWSANTSAGGDRNVIYRSEGEPILRSSHWQVPAVPEDDRTPAHPASVLFDRLKRHVGADDVIVAAHVGGRYADVRRYHDGDLCRLVEVASCWGVFEWLLFDALDAGHIVGVVCNSDGHKGRPGAEGPGAGEFGISGGLTCALASELNRDAIFDALRRRQCYGTTGPRIVLSFEIDRHPMGSVLEVDGDVTAHASVQAAAPIESLTLMEGREPVVVVRPPAFDEAASSRRIRVRWQGARIRGRGRRVTWNGVISVDGTEIERARTFGFDSAADGITEQSARHVRFRSHTTGDSDGIDLWLDQTERGSIVFESPVGRCQAAFHELAPERSWSLGGIDVRVSFQRYPEQVTERELGLSRVLQPPAGRPAPYLAKVTQVDGHMAWSSPVYVSRRERGSGS
jgi:hypothetical protein